MKFEIPFSAEDFKRSDTVPQTHVMVASAWFASVQAYLVFVEDVLKPVTKTLIRRSSREEVILDLHAAMVGFTACVNALREPIYVQGIASCARSLFELFVDLSLVHSNAVPDAAEKFREFVTVERFQSAKAMVKHCADKPPDYVGCSGMEEAREWVKNSGPIIDATNKRLWGKWPRHWSGIDNAAERAKKAGEHSANLYAVYYKRISWFVHTASVGTVGVPKEDMHALIANALELMRQVVPNAFEIVGVELGLDKDIDDYGGKVQFLRRVPVLALTDLQLQQLGEPQRFSLV